MAKPEHCLNVLFHKQLAGYLRLVDGKLSFVYSPEYLANPQAIKLSFALPLQTAPFDEQRSKAFFGGLLPEGKLRTLLSQQYGVSKANDFALLREIGGECAGAVSLLFDSKLAEQPSTQAITWLSQTELSELIQTLPQRPMLAGQDGLRLSLAGAQSKLPVTVRQNASNELFSIGRPAINVPSTHILKPAIARLKDTAQNELFCMSLARQLRIHTPPTYWSWQMKYRFF
jgi:serine/threonine-protein kinase HipA